MNFELKTPLEEWKLIWSDNFDGPAGSPPDPGKWGYDTGDGCPENCGWGNQELEFYTSSTENAALNGNGQLAITARIAPEGLNCYYGNCRYTSARLKTRGKFTILYGRIEARMKLPAGQGLWPAFWMLGVDFPTISWPVCGEIDIMEFRGSLTNRISSALHGPGYSGNTPLMHTFTLPDGNFTEDFHLFALEWEREQMRFWVDQILHYTVSKTDVERYGPWVFDRPFFMLMNLAVGGHFDGNPASDDIFPAEMLVDFVRVYARTAVHLPLIGK